MTVRISGDNENALDHACDLCGTTQSSVVAPASSARCRIVLCPTCRLLYASPQFSPVDLDAFYDEHFDGDAGSRLRARAGFPEEHKIRSEEKRATRWALPIIQRFMQVAGKRVLDLRCRSGALSAALTAAGAAVFSVDPFEANVRYAQQVRGLSHVCLVPFSRFHQLPLPDHSDHSDHPDHSDHSGEYDAVSLLTEHVLAHVLSPRTLLSHIFALLRPGGYVFLDEKDVLRPARYQTRSVFDSGPVHLYHLSRHVTAHYLQSVGFEILECGLDTQRVSSHRHIRAVARKPEGRTVAVGVDQPFAAGPTAEEICRRLWWLERTWRVSRAQVVTKRTIRRFFRRRRSL